MNTWRDVNSFLKNRMTLTRTCIHAMAPSGKNQLFGRHGRYETCIRLINFSLASCDLKDVQCNVQRVAVNLHYLKTNEPTKHRLLLSRRGSFRGEGIAVWTKPWWWWMWLSRPPRLLSPATPEWGMMHPFFYVGSIFPVNTFIILAFLDAFWHSPNSILMLPVTNTTNSEAQYLSHLHMNY